MAPQTAQRPGPRVHRLPRRLDYMLVPAPLDLSLDTMTEKSPLPAIIVTPSSPTHPKDFSIAFLAPPKKPSLRERFRKHLSKASEAVAAKWSASTSALRSESPIALPLSAPVTTTEFSFNSSSSSSYPAPSAKRNSRILMVVATVFLLVFCHMLAHFAAYASTVTPGASAMTSASVQDADLLLESGSTAATASAGAVHDAYSYLKADFQRLVGWVAAGAATHDHSGSAALSHVVDV